MQLVNREYAVAVARKETEDIRKLNFHRILNGKNFWVADPFPIEIEGILYIFGEIYEYSTNKGSIGYTKYVSDGFSPWKIVISEDYHLSFPNIFRVGEEIYICPEACGSGELYLYKAKKFPDLWEKDRVLCNNCNFSDTIFYKKDRIYAFTCEWNSLDNHCFKMLRIENEKIVESKGELDTLDFYLTRPAGKIIQNRDKTEYMVSQICKPLYGSGLIIKEFEVNWPNYSEKEILRIFPEQINVDKKEHYVGMHTLNYSENYVVIDLIWERFSPIRKLIRLRSKLISDK